MRKKAIIISIKSYHLSIKEQMLIKNEKPWGLILFKRNIKSLTQVIELIKKIRKFSKDSKFPIMIDEEGETVSRLSEIINHNFSQKLFGDIYKHNPKIALIIYKNYINNLTALLKKIGINIKSFGGLYGFKGSFWGLSITFLFKLISFSDFLSLIRLIIF